MESFKEYYSRIGLFETTEKKRMYLLNIPWIKASQSSAMNCINYYFVIFLGYKMKGVMFELSETMFLDLLGNECRSPSFSR